MQTRHNTAIQFMNSIHCRARVVQHSRACWTLIFVELNSKAWLRPYVSRLTSTRRFQTFFIYFYQYLPRTSSLARNSLNGVSNKLHHIYHGIYLVFVSLAVDVWNRPRDALNNSCGDYHIACFYMAVCRKDWKLPNSWIWLAEIDVDRGLDFPM